MKNHSDSINRPFDHASEHIGKLNVFNGEGDWMRYQMTTLLEGVSEEDRDAITRNTESPDRPWNFYAYRDLREYYDLPPGPVEDDHIGDASVRYFPDENQVLIKERLQGVLLACAHSSQRVPVTSKDFQPSDTPEENLFPQYVHKGKPAIELQGIIIAQDAVAPQKTYSLLLDRAKNQVDRHVTAYLWANIPDDARAPIVEEFDHFAMLPIETLTHDLRRSHFWVYPEEHWNQYWKRK